MEIPSVGLPEDYWLTKIRRNCLNSSRSSPSSSPPTTLLYDASASMDNNNNNLSAYQRKVWETGPGGYRQPYHLVEQRSPIWHAIRSLSFGPLERARVKRITASVRAKAMGFFENWSEVSLQRPRETQLVRCALQMADEIPPDPVNDAMEFGTRTEPKADELFVNWYTREYEDYAEKKRRGASSLLEYPGVLLDYGDPCGSAFSPDGVAWDMSFTVEYKCRLGYALKGAKPYHFPQVQDAMGNLGIDTNYLVLFSYRNARICRIEFNRGYYEMMRSYFKLFRNLVMKYKETRDDLWLQKLIQLAQSPEVVRARTEAHGCVWEEVACLDSSTYLAPRPPRDT
jgi:hypothetical protein